MRLLCGMKVPVGHEQDPVAASPADHRCALATKIDGTREA